MTVPNISYHLKRIFTSGELEPEMVIKEILITAQSGVRGLSEEKVKYYNLDAILSLGYRVNSVQATAFRKWATSVLKQYMLKGYVVNHNAVSEQKYEDLKPAGCSLWRFCSRGALAQSCGVGGKFSGTS